MHYNQIMKRILLSILVVGALCSSLSAQNLSSATAAYQRFVQLNNSGGSRDEMFTSLYQAYLGYTDVLKNSTQVSSGVMEAKQALRNIRPYLQNGAVHYSQKGVQRTALQFARAFVDIPLMEQFSSESFTNNEYYPTLVYFAASGTYNSADYRGAIPYFKEYLATGQADKRKEVYMFMAKAYQNIEDHDAAALVLDEAINAYPTDFNLLSMGINAAIDHVHYSNLDRYVSAALKMRPNDVTLLNIQGKLYEDTGDYQKAYATYTRLSSLRPQSLDVAKHLALNSYNLGVLYNNKSVSEKSKSLVETYNTRSREYFAEAIPVIENVLISDPTSLQFLTAAANAYHCTGNSEKLADANDKISALGGEIVAENSIPVLMAFNDKQNAAGFTGTSSIGGNVSVALPENSLPYSQYAKQFVEDRLKIWQAKDPYETVDEYRERVNEESRNAKVKELLAQAEITYIKNHSTNIKLSDLMLHPYDADHEVFFAESAYGEIIIPVPRANNEARIFESSWNGIQLKNPKFYIANDQLALSSLTFVVPSGKSYVFDNKDALDYTETHVDVQFDKIDYGQLASTNNRETRSHVRTSEVSVGNSDVDINIPETKLRNEKTFAVIIANEDYEMVAKVPMALNDGRTLGEYCNKTLGLPKSNIRIYENATYGTMLRAVRDIEKIADAYSGDISVIFYYAGHGIPNEATKDAYLMPVDADGLQTEVCYSLNKLYTKLGALNTRSTLVLLDACFSGSNRDGDMLASARGVALKAKVEEPKGNMIIFSAASGDETAFPYKEKGHGLFTYFLLKKLQETRGNVTLAELSKYVTENVTRQSVVINRKSQTPHIAPAESMSESWREIVLIPEIK